MKSASVTSADCRGPDPGTQGRGGQDDAHGLAGRLCAAGFRVRLRAPAARRPRRRRTDQRHRACQQHPRRRSGDRPHAPPARAGVPLAAPPPPGLGGRLGALPRRRATEYLGLVNEVAATRHPKTRRVGVLVAPSAPQRCSQEFLGACAGLADELDLPIITHVQETRLQVVTGLEFYGSPIVEYLARIKFLGPRTTLIHAVWLNPREIRALAETGATAQYNPWSNQTLGSGVQPVRALLDAGVNVSLGSDGASSTVSLNMLQVVGSAAALSKVRGDDYSRWLSAREALTPATPGRAQALGFGTSLGVIERGAIADLVAYRLDTLPFTPLNDPVRQLVYAERGAGLDFAMVAGEVMLRDGRFTRVDEARLLAEIETEVAGLAAQFAAADASVAPVRAAIEKIYRRSLATSIPPDTYPARLP